MPQETKGLTKEAIYNRLLYSITRLSPGGLPKEVEALNAKFGAGEVTWEAIYALELAQIDLMPDEELRVKLGLLREEFGLAASEAEQRRMEAKPIATMTTPELKGEAAALLEELQQRRFSQFRFENARATTTLIVIILMVVVGIVAYYWRKRIPLAYPILRTLFYTGYCGLVGSGFSYLARLRALEWGPKFGNRTMSNGTMLKILLTNMLVSLSSGVIAANALYFVMALGFVKIGTPTQDAATVWLSQGLWAFIAGFAERLVPDKLNQLAALVAEQKAAK